MYNQTKFTDADTTHSNALRRGTQREGSSEHMERTQQEHHVLVAKVRRLLDQNRQLRETVQTLVAAHTMAVQEQDAEILRLVRENHQLRIATESRETRSREGGAQ